MSRQYCTVARAYQIADDCMLAQFIAHSVCTESGWRMEDEPAREAARWLISRGFAKAHQGLVILVEPVVQEDDE